MDEPDLGRGAKWQADEYRAGRDGLSARGKDYHPDPSSTSSPRGDADRSALRQGDRHQADLRPADRSHPGCKTASVILFNPQLATSRASVGFKVRIPNGYPRPAPSRLGETPSVSDSTRRSLRTAYQAILALVTVIPLLIAGLSAIAPEGSRPRHRLRCHRRRSGRRHQGPSTPWRTRASSPPG